MEFEYDPAKSAKNLTKRGKRIRIISVRRSRKNEEAYYDSQD